MPKFKLSVTNTSVDTEIVQLWMTCRFWGDGERHIQIQWLNAWMRRSISPCWGPWSCTWSSSEGLDCPGQIPCPHWELLPPWNGTPGRPVREICSLPSAIYMLFQGLPGFLKQPQTPFFNSCRNEGLEDHYSSSAAVSSCSRVWRRKHI